MRIGRPLLTLALVWLIALTGLLAATDRGRAVDGAGQVVLCAGSGPQTVPGDHGPGLCPDCALKLFAAGIQPLPAVPVPALRRLRAVQPATPRAAAGRPAPPPAARGPPALA